MKVSDKQSKMLWAKAVKGQGMTKEQLAAFLGTRYGVSKTEELEGGKENVDGYIHAIENWKSGQPTPSQAPGGQQAPATPEKKAEPWTVNRKSDPQDRTSIERQKALAEAVNWASGQYKDPLEVIEVAKKFLDFIGSGCVPFSAPVDETLPMDDAPIDKPIEVIKQMPEAEKHQAELDNAVVDCLGQIELMCKELFDTSYFQEGVQFNKPEDILQFVTAHKYKNGLGIEQFFTGYRSYDAISEKALSITHRKVKELWNSWKNKQTDCDNLPF